tara:strand:+ start:6903 stop:7976 length:1074 start_codon:yes stop_codon:yes gene_type:complete
MFKKKIKISNTVFIGDGQPCFIIGEIGSNHNRSKTTVKLLIDACADAKFDAVKFQIYDPELAFSKNLRAKDVNLSKLYGANTPWWKVARDKILMPRSWFKEMYKYAKKKKLIVFSTIHLLEDYYFLKQIGVPLIKIASIDLEYNFLINQLSKLKIPTILSTGMANVNEISNTIKIFRKNKNPNLAVLHCVSQYPPPDQDANLKNIQMIKDKFKCIAGYSDHSADNLSASLSVFQGAKIVEKHITLDKKYPGPDHPFAIEPKEMIDLVNNIRRAEKMLGQYDRVISKGDLKAKKMIRRSIVLKKDIKAGEKITLNNIKFARPPTGISPNRFDDYKNKKIKKNLKAETILKVEHFLNAK